MSQPTLTTVNYIHPNGTVVGSEFVVDALPDQMVVVPLGAPGVVTRIRLPKFCREAFLTITDGANPPALLDGYVQLDREQLIPDGTAITHKFYLPPGVATEFRTGVGRGRDIRGPVILIEPVTAGSVVRIEMRSELS